jgi:hypothetical protein
MRLLVPLLAILALVACGGHKSASAEDVARTWSAALDRNDNESAADLFADDATIVQNGELVLHSHVDAVRWNASLPCGGKIVSATAHGANEVLLVFTLSERPHHACDGPGGTAAALFRVRGGKITLWHQTAVPQGSGSGQTI